ncbi:MAG: FAD-dependent oxidoreductase [Clostridia bacterium]|nr:FAD-dependent oxidoreductase [Clostridia bacterium]
MEKSTEKHFVPLTLEQAFDVAVVGGGLAGTMAAVAAAREGKKVVLIEKYGYLGGMATAGLVYPFMKHTENGSGKPANAGLYFQLLKEIYEIGGSDGAESRHYKEEFMKVVLDRMTKRYGVQVLFHSKLCSVERAERRIQSITVSTVSGKIQIRAGRFVDATGNADLTAFAGFAYEQGREEDGLCQPMTLCFRLGNVDWSRFDHAAANKLYREFQAAGKIQNPRENILIFHHPFDNVMHMNTTRAIGIDPTNVFDVSKAEMLLREQMLEMYRFMKENIPGLENCELISSAAESGIRESRRIVGLVKVTADDLIHTRKFEDSIARGTYAIDIHNPSGTGTYLYKMPENDYYTIPYRALVPQDADNLIVAGRCICTTHEALAAVRIMPITTCMGEAAGIAAAMATDADCTMAQVDVQALREKIVSYGGLV